ncbi:ATP-binding protein [Streptomyces angustmyceticus]|uniref:ATP-binding protein n=1 Tax=Streptomyces angustmyceticus TaxID=285578 RepID=A0A5J4L2A1_9ACTN|nr:ATP-binding protein [Streptomyces angustmyceticus]UAL66656.1 ATP-binding protein [Streptomyces angustmyceticus]GES28487.1 ATP-binding protein [Streptomyces angustmyceticus]
MRGVPARAAEARNFVHDLLHRTASPVDDLALVDALLVTTELVTNAQRHAGGLTGFTARIVDGYLELAVEDGSEHCPTAPAPRRPGTTGGYGWPLIQRLARTVDIALTATGKTIRVTLPL